MRFAAAMALITACPPLAHAQDQDYPHDSKAIGAVAPSEALITITINPEARVSVARTGEVQQSMACEEPMELPVRIINNGYVTASLEVSLVDSIPADVTLAFPGNSLKGTKEEHRSLQVTLQKPGIADITIAFRAKNDMSDLGGRDRIHLLLRCT